MQKQIYEDYKYCMQDSTFLYVGAKYTLGEIVENQDIMFKFRKVFGESVLPKCSPDDTLETHLYYLDSKDFLFQIYKQMRAKVRVSVIADKWHLFGGRKKEYVTEFWTIEKLCSMSTKEKEACGLVIQEMKVSKLSLMTV